MIDTLREEVAAVAQRRRQPGERRVEALRQLGQHRHGDLRRDGGRSRPPVGREIAKREVRLVADGADRRDARRRDRAHERLVVEAEEILERPAPARDNQQVRTPGRRTEVLDAGDDRRRRALALDEARVKPDLDCGEPPGEDRAHVVDDGARLARHDCDAARHERQRTLARGGEEPFRLQLRLELEIALHELSLARELRGEDDELVVAARRIDSRVGVDEHLRAVLEPVLRLAALECAREHDGRNLGPVVLQREIAVPRRIPLPSADLGLDVDAREAAFDQRLQRGRQRRDGIGPRLGGFRHAAPSSCGRRDRHAVRRTGSCPRQRTRSSCSCRRS